MYRILFWIIFYFCVFFDTGYSQQFKPFNVKFSGIDSISGVLHFVLKKSCRDNKDKQNHGIASTLMIVSLKQKSIDQFKQCKYELTEDDLYILEGLDAENTFLSFSNLNQYQFSKVITKVMSDWGNCFLSNSTAFDSVITKTTKLKYYFLCNQPILSFEINKDDFIRMFDKLFTHEIYVVPSTNRVKIGLIFNRKSNLIDSIIPYIVNIDSLI